MVFARFSQNALMSTVFSTSLYLMSHAAYAMLEPEDTENLTATTSASAVGADEVEDIGTGVLPSSVVSLPEGAVPLLHPLLGRLAPEDSRLAGVRVLFEEGRSCGANFSGLDFRGVDLSRCVTKGCDFRGADLRGTGIEQADTFGSLFVGCHLNQLYSEEFPYFNHGGYIQQFEFEGHNFDLRQAQEAIDGLRTRCSQPDRDPLSRLILAYALSVHGAFGEEREAMELYEELGSIEGKRLNSHIRAIALNNWAFMLEMGRGVEEANKADARKQAGQLYETNQNEGDTAFFNFVRFYAVYNGEIGGQYKLAELFAEGKGVEQDFKKSFHWYKSVADEAQESRAQYAVGLALLKGEGVTKDLQQGAEYIRRSAEREYRRAQFLYSQLLGRGEGVPLDPKLSAIYCQRAAEQSLEEARVHMGEKFLNGEGVPRNLKAAIQYFRGVAVIPIDDEGMKEYILRARIRLAHTYYLLASKSESDEGKQKNLKESFKWYSQAQAGDQVNSEVLYGLGMHYYRGGAVAKDIGRSRALIQQAADMGHEKAQRHLHFVNPAYERFIRQKAANERLYDKVRHAKSIKAFNGLIKLYKLKKEFKKVQKVLKEFAKKQRHLPVRINTDAIPADPYECEFMEDINTKVEDGLVALELFDTYFDDIQEGYSRSPAFVADLAENLETIRAQLKRGDINLRKKFVFLYQAWCSGEDRVLPPADANPQHFHNGRIGAKLLQNIGRCNDGMSDFLDEERWRLLSHIEEDIPLYVRLSQVVAQYKLEFINRHKNPLSGAHEEAVEATQLLQQRMRLPLGLPVNFVNLYNPLHGMIYDKDKYDPKKVMIRFLEGGTVTFKTKTEECVREFQAYTPDFLISLMRCAVEDKDNGALELGHFNLYIQTDPLLQEAYEVAFVEFEENQYFDPMAAGSQVYKDAFIEYLLVRFGYLVKDD